MSSVGYRCLRFLRGFFRTMKVVAPLTYVAGAALIWWDFASSNPDGLANIWIAVYTFPMFLIGSFLLGLDFPYTPGRYYQAHALYFWPSVAILAVCLFAIFHALQWIAQKRVG